VARALKAFTFVSGGFQRFGVFWDYGSLMQHGSLSKRTEAEDELFKQGLGWLGSFYSHPHTYVFRLTSFPEGYPDGYDLPSDANVAAYPERGCVQRAAPCPSTRDPPRPQAPLSPRRPSAAFPRARCTHSPRRRAGGASPRRAGRP